MPFFFHLETIGDANICMCPKGEDTVVRSLLSIPHPGCIPALFPGQAPDPELTEQNIVESRV